MRSFADTGVRLTIGTPEENAAALAVLGSGATRPALTSEPEI
jgi:histidinol-phosphate/aromatic aminotransferase/cobyric acid decarboxylase-like protein